MIPNEFGSILKDSRRNKHLTQTEIAKLLNISRQAYCNYELGRCCPPVDKLADLCVVLDTDLFSVFLQNSHMHHYDIL